MSKNHRRVPGDSEVTRTHAEAAVDFYAIRKDLAEQIGISSIQSALQDAIRALGIENTLAYKKTLSSVVLWLAKSELLRHNQVAEIFSPPKPTPKPL